MYKCLIANGDCYTAGDELSDYKPEMLGGSLLTWAGFLARYAKIPYTINLAVSGGGSAKQICRTTIDTVYKLLSQNRFSPQEIFVSVMYGAYIRTELPMPGRGNGWWRIWTGQTHEITKIWYKYCHSDQSSKFLFFQHILFLQLYLEKLGVKYLFTFCDGLAFEPTYSEYDCYKYLINTNSFYFIPHPKKKFFGFVQWAEEQKYKQFSNGHFIENAHEDFVNMYLGPWFIKNHVHESP